MIWYYRFKRISKFTTGLLMLSSLVNCRSISNVVSGSDSKGAPAAAAASALVERTPATYNDQLPNDARKIADEDGEFKVPKNSTIYYGANGRYVPKTVSGTARCDNDLFGDPVVGVRKACFIVESRNAGHGGGAGGGRDHDRDRDWDDYYDWKWLSKSCVADVPAAAVPLSTSAIDREVKEVRQALVNIDDTKVLNISDVKGVVLAGRSQTATVSNVRGPVSFITNILNSYSDIRGPSVIRARAAGAVSDLDGPLYATLNQVQSIKDVEGSVCLTTNSATEISNIRGPIRIFGGSGAEIELIKDTRGPLYLENVNLGKLENHRGAIYLKNSKIFEQVNVRGQINML